MTKPYTWEEIKSFLEKELKKTKHIMTFGTIGSCNIETDIDIIITKKPNSGSVEFYKEVHHIYDTLDNHLRKKGAKIIRFYNLTDENFLKILGVIKRNDLLMHTMIYQSFNQMILDWAGQNLNLKKLIKNEYKCLIGKPENLFKKEFYKRKKYDADYNFVYHSDRTSSNMPEAKIVKFMNWLFMYIFKKMLKEKTLVGKDKKQIRQILYGILDKIDIRENKVLNE